MIINKINHVKGKRLLVTDDDYYPIDDVNRYLLYLSNARMAFNTVLNYAKCLCIFYDYISIKKETILDVSKVRHPLTYFSCFADYLEFDNNNCILRKPNTINYIINVVWRYLDFLVLDGVISDNPIGNHYSNKNKYTFLKEFLPKHISKRRFVIRKQHAEKKISIDRSIFLNLVDLIFPRDESSFYYSKYLTRSLTNKELVQLRNMCMIELMAGAGLRIGEVLGLKIEDLSDLEIGCIHIVKRTDNPNHAYAKTGDGKVFISSKIVSDINLLVCETMKTYDTEFVFINYYGENIGRPVVVDSVEALFKTFTIKLRKKGLLEAKETIHPHMLRHLFASNSIDCSHDIFETQEFLRHKNVTTTMAYYHLDDSKRIELAKKMEEVLFKNE